MVVEANRKRKPFKVLKIQGTKCRETKKILRQPKVSNRRKLLRLLGWGRGGPPLPAKVQTVSIEGCRSLGFCPKDVTLPLSARDNLYTNGCSCVFQ